MSSKKKALSRLIESEQQNKKTISDKLRSKAFLIAISAIVLIVTAVSAARFGALPSSVTPSFLAAGPVAGPVPTPTPPQLSKSYVYAGSRLLSVEDANAQQQSATDLAVWRKSDGSWWVLNGISGGTSGTFFGMDGDIPAPADFDGDSKTDFCVWRPSTGVWYIIQSSNGTSIGYTFGVQGDQPVPSDYDGDGKADIAVYR